MKRTYQVSVDVLKFCKHQTPIGIRTLRVKLQHNFKTEFCQKKRFEDMLENIHKINAGDNF